MSGDDLVPISEDGDEHENQCSICGAWSGHPCTIDDPDRPGLGVELMRKVHRNRLTDNPSELRARIKSLEAELAAVREPLTDEQIDAVTRQQWGSEQLGVILQAHRAYARAIAALIQPPKEAP